MNPRAGSEGGHRPNYFHSLRVQVGIFLFLLALLAAVIFLFGWLPRHQRIQFDQERGHVEEHLATLSDALLPYLIQDQLGAVHETLDTLLERQPEWRVLILHDQRGKRLYPLFPETIPHGNSIHRLSHEIRLRGQRYGDLVLYLDAAPFLAAARQRNQELAALFFGVMMTAFLFIGLFLELIAGRPARQLAGAAERLAEGDYKAGLPAPGKNEVGELIHSFEQMRETIRGKETSLIEARHQAETANRAKSMFLANMSHELRTPLNSVLGFAQLMAADGDTTGRQKERLDIIQRSGEHLLDLLNDLLDLSKIEAGTTSLELAPFDTAGLLSGIEDMFRQRAEAKKVCFSVSIAVDVPKTVVSDVRKIRQTLLNLVGNALKFTDSGSVNLHTSWHPDGLLEFEVRDTGPGIAAENLETIFNPFERGDQEGSHADGAGLGLAICRRFVEHMEGDIRVESRIGEGSVFTASIPVSVDHQTAAVRLLSSPHSASCDTGGYRITGECPRVLVVDDDRDSRDALAALLSNTGIEVASGADGREAVDLQANWQPDLVFMDIQMPGMDGAEACEIIKRTGPAAPRIVFLTASFNEKQDLPRRDSSDGWLRKPFRFSEVIEALESQLDIRFERISAAPDHRPAVADSETGADERIPGEILQSLADASARVEFSAVQDCLKEVQKADPESYACFSELAADFRYEELEQLVRGMIAPDRDPRNVSPAKHSTGQRALNPSLARK